MGPTNICRNLAQVSLNQVYPSLTEFSSVQFSRSVVSDSLCPLFCGDSGKLQLTFSDGGKMSQRSQASEVSGW